MQSGQSSPRQLRGADLIEARFVGANLSDADLSGANQLEAKLPFSDLRGANLADADLSGADLTGANLMDANLHGATLNWAQLDNALITDEQLRTVKSRLQREDLTDLVRLRPRVGVKRSKKDVSTDM